MKRKLGRIWRHIQMTDTVMAEASDRIRELREREERLEDTAEDARAILSQRRKALDDVNTITAYPAKDTDGRREDSDFLGS